MRKAEKLKTSRPKVGGEVDAAAQMTVVIVRAVVRAVVLVLVVVVSVHFITLVAVMMTLTVQAVAS